MAEKVLQVSGYLETCANSVGHIAFQLLAYDQLASVVGSTSRGMFLQTASRWLIFLSYERHRSPLTLSLSVGEALDTFRSIAPGAMALVRSGRLIFPVARVVVSWSANSVWCPVFASQAVRPLSEQLESLNYFVRTALTVKNSHGLSSLLPSLLYSPSVAIAREDVDTPLGEILRLRQALSEGQVSSAVNAVHRLVGRGGGLTPSGDDLLIGLLLLLNRYPSGYHLSCCLHPFNQAVIDIAYERTTRLSANLIECATLGYSDERLVDVVDCITTGTPEAAECVAAWLGWGASSGVDALVGISLALTI